MMGVIHLVFNEAQFAREYFHTHNTGPPVGPSLTFTCWELSLMLSSLLRASSISWAFLFFSTCSLCFRLATFLLWSFICLHRERTDRTARVRDTLPGGGGRGWVLLEVGHISAGFGCVFGGGGVGGVSLK